MSDPMAGPAYQFPSDYDAGSEPVDPYFAAPMNPDGSEIGPLVLSPEGETWINQNVVDKGYVIDWGTREIIDPETGEVKGTVPTSVPRMV